MCSFDRSNQRLFRHSKWPHPSAILSGSGMRSDFFLSPTLICNPPVIAAVFKPLSSGFGKISKKQTVVMKTTVDWLREKDLNQRPSGYEFVVRHLRAWWREKWKSKFYRAVSEFPFWRKILSLCYAWASALLDRFSAIGKVLRFPSGILFLVCNEEECLRSSSDAFLLAWWVQCDWKSSSIPVR